MMELWTMEKLSKNIFEFDEEWKEDRRGHCGSLDNRKLSKNIFEFDKSVVLYHCQRTRIVFKRIFPLKFKSMDDGTLDDRKLSENMFEFDEGWGEKTLDDEKLCKNIFESK